MGSTFNPNTPKVRVLESLALPGYPCLHNTFQDNWSYTEKNVSKYLNEHSWIYICFSFFPLTHLFPILWPCKLEFYCFIEIDK